MLHIGCADAAAVASVEISSCTLFALVMMLQAKPLTTAAHTAVHASEAELPHSSAPMAAMAGG